MENLKVTETAWPGTFDATLTTGARVRLAERNGNLEVRVVEGLLAVAPRAANVVEIVPVDWDGQAVAR